MAYNSTKLNEYYGKKKEIEESAVYRINSNKSEEIMLFVQDQKAAETIREELKDSGEFKITLHNPEKAREEIEALDQEYAETLKNAPALGKGAPGFMPISQFYDAIKYACQYVVGPWIISHILGDVDDAAWNKVKELISAAIKTLSILINDDRKFAFIIEGRGKKDLVFLFEKTLSDEEIQLRISEVHNTLSGNDAALLTQHTFAPLVFEFDEARKLWVDKSEKYFKMNPGGFNVDWLNKK
jgi:hypothetical protein